MLKSLAAKIRTELLTPPGDQLDALHGLRAIASFLVISFHVAIFTGNISLSPDTKGELSAFYLVINGLWSGLDFFFVLSGFLIGRILMTNLHRSGSIQFPRFFIRRAFRVFPAYYLVLTLATFVYAGSGIGIADWHLSLGNLPAMQANAWQNYLYVMNYTYGVYQPNPMSWAWSLCVEEHFYLLLPPVLVLAYGFKRPIWRIRLLVGFTLLPLVLRMAQYLRDPGLVLNHGFYFRTHNRMDEILIGVLIAYFYVHHRESFRAFATRHRNWIDLSGVGIIVLTWALGGLQQTGMFAVVFQFQWIAIGTGLIIINALFLDNRLTRLLAHRAWYPWARISYGMYLTHPYVLFWLAGTTALFPKPTSLTPPQFMLLYVGVLLGSGLVAALSFVILERPMIDLGMRLSRNLGVKPSR